MKITQSLILDPPIKSLNHHAMFLGVLFLNPTYKNHFLTHYANLYYDFNFKLVNFISPKFYTEESFFVSTEIGYDNPDIVSEKYFFELIQHMMNEGYYIYGNVNEKYIPNRDAYQKHDLTHNILFYGLDTVDKKFDSIAYIHEMDSSFQYKPEKLDYYNFINSIKNTHEESYTHFSKNYIHFFKNKPSYSFSFDARLLLTQLDDYLSSKNTTFSTQCNPNRVYGICVYDAIIAMFKASEEINLRTTKLLLEHKQCMLQKIEYIILKNIIHPQSYTSEYKKIVRAFDKVHLLAIKYNLTKSKSIKEALYAEIKHSIEKEEKILGKVLIDLSSVK